MITLPIELYGGQYLFVGDTHNLLALVGGVGSGKTIGGAARAIAAAYGTIGTKQIQAPNTGMITAPTYNVLRDATIPTFRTLAGDLIADMNTTPPINATMSNGSVIFFRSAEQPELLRGPSISWFWGDEAALYHRDVWRIMLGRLRQFGQLGYAWLTTTPKGRNWLYVEFVQKQRPAYHSYKLRTWQNPFVDAPYYAMLKESYTGDFARQELEGDFVAFEGLIYEDFDRDAHMTSAPFPTAFAGGIVAGVDWGYANPGAIVVYGVDGDGRMWGLHEEYQRRRRIEEWSDVASQLNQQYKISHFYADPSEPDFILKFQQAGVNCQPADNEVIAGIQSVKARLKVQGDGLPRLILPYSFVNLASEMEQYSWMENRDGLRDQPKKANDHALDATRYAVRGVDSMFGLTIGAMNYADYTGIGSGDY